MKIFQTYSGPRQQSYLASGVIPYDYSGNGGTEYEIFKDVSRNGGAHLKSQDAWGVLSWKFDIKCHISVQQFKTLAQPLLNDGADCVFINPMVGAEAVFNNVWEQGVAYGHTGIERMLPFLIDRLYIKPEDLFMSAEIFAFCNFFIARERFWRRYFDYVDGVLADLEFDARMGGAAGILAAGPSHYVKNPALSMKPFIVERLFSSFLPQSNLDVRCVRLDLSVYKAKFGALLGNTLYRLSCLKNRSEAPSCATRVRWGNLARQITSGPSLMTIMHLDDPDIYIADVGLAAA
jgi:hypothetical protein